MKTGTEKTEVRKSLGDLTEKLKGIKKSEIIRQVFFLAIFPMKPLGKTLKTIVGETKFAKSKELIYLSDPMVDQKDVGNIFIQARATFKDNRV